MATLVYRGDCKNIPLATDTVSFMKPIVVLHKAISEVYEHYQSTALHLAKDFAAGRMSYDEYERRHMQLVSEFHRKRMEIYNQESAKSS